MGGALYKKTVDHAHWGNGKRKWASVIQGIIQTAPSYEKDPAV
jgi:hypothetical protein